jgi:hypothetical protein
MNGFLYLRFHHGMAVHRLGGMNNHQCLEGKMLPYGIPYFIKRIEVWSPSNKPPKVEINNSSD